MDDILERINSCARTLLAAFLLAFSACAWAAPRTIFIVESYHESLAWDQEYRKALVRRLGGRYLIASANLDAKRQPKARQEELADQAFEQIRQSRPVLVVMGDDPALRLIGARIDKLGIPGVYLGINNNPRVYGNFTNITGVLERPLMKRNTVLVREMQPGLRKILVLFDGDEISQLIFKEEFLELSHYTIGGVEVDVKLVETQAAWQQAVANAKRNGYGAIVAGLYLTLRGEDGQVVDENKIISWTSANTPVPLYCFWDWQVGSEKAIGGLVLSGNTQGEAAADIVEQILEHGVKPASIFPRGAQQSEYVFSRAQLKRFKLRLPKEVAARARFVD